MVCLGKGWSSILDPADKIPQDENKTKSSHGYCLFLCDSCHRMYIEMVPMSCPSTVQNMSSFKFTHILYILNLYKSYGNFHNQTFPP